MNSLLETAFSISPYSGVDFLPGGTVHYLQYADVVLLSEHTGSLQDLLDGLDKSASMFKMRFAPPKCKVKLQDWVRMTPNLSIGSQSIERVDKFTYLSSSITRDSNRAQKLSLRIQKVRLTFSNLHHLWRQMKLNYPQKVGYIQRQGT